ncbi:MAG: hypothetical protein LC793_22040 [Thermomicrobia bacterium]|nr:hypothetical protein [Thermomicrobia bacterium]
MKGGDWIERAAAALGRTHGAILKQAYVQERRGPAPDGFRAAIQQGRAHIQHLQSLTPIHDITPPTGHRFAPGSPEYAAERDAYADALVAGIDAVIGYDATDETQGRLTTAEYNIYGTTPTAEGSTHWSPKRPLLAGVGDRGDDPWKIYLAGKIGRRDWRHTIATNLDQYPSDMGTHAEGEPLGEWPIIAKTIFGEHALTGPFFIACDHGCYHGPNEHAYGLSGDGCCGSQEKTTSRIAVVDLCRNAIAAADFVYCWLDGDAFEGTHLTAYGTIAELGMAFALGKNVGIAVDPAVRELLDPSWFALHTGNVIESPDAASGLRWFLSPWRLSLRGNAVSVLGRVIA